MGGARSSVNCGRWAARGHPLLNGPDGLEGVRPARLSSSWCRLHAHGSALSLRIIYSEQGAAAQVDGCPRTGVAEPEVGSAALRASQDHAHRSAIEFQGPERALAAATRAGDHDGGGLDCEQGGEAPGGGIAVERDEFVVHLRSPLGPKRSVLIRAPSWPSATSA